MKSAVIPFYNEQDSLAELIARLGKVFDSEDEMILVDDGSTDASSQKVRQSRQAEPRVRLISLAGHQGKAAALNAGFRAAKGEIIVTLDADLQDQPEEIPKLLKKLAEGYDLVTGWKAVRHDSWWIRQNSRFFNSLISHLTPLKIRDVNCGLKVYRRQAIEDLSLYGNLHRFIPVLIAQRGFKVAEVPVTHAPRKYGRSKYSPFKAVGGFFDLFTILFLIRFRSRPFHFFGMIGLTMMAIGLTMSGYLTLLWLQGETIGRRPLLLLGVLLIIVGLQLVTTGLIAELMISLHHETKNKL